MGGARTAILNWLLARHDGGELVIRLEDTDVERNVPGAEDVILDDLRWLGLDWDEGPDVGGPHAPYRQSERLEIYGRHAERLLEAGAAYHCTCPPQATAQGSDRRRCACADRSPPAPATEGASIRFRAPDAGEVRLDDLVRGGIAFPAESVEDFVLIRSDGRPTYNFAAAVDDVEMRISHVIRGADHLNNTPKQLLLHQALGWEPPRYAHIPLILGEDRQKLSKRHGATSVAEHRRLGYLPEALLNYLSLLSWSSPTGEEVLPRERLIREIALDRVGASDAVFDRDKLRWLSGRYVQSLEPPDLARRLRPFVAEGEAADDERMLAIAAALRDRISTLTEAEGALSDFAPPEAPAERAARAAALADPEAAATVDAVRQALADLPEWEEQAINSAIRGAGAAAGARGRALFGPVRLALTGREHGPDLARVALVLGRRRTIEQLTPEDEHEV